MAGGSGGTADRGGQDRHCRSTGPVLHDRPQASAGAGPSGSRARLAGTTPGALARHAGSNGQPRCSCSARGVIQDRVSDPISRDSSVAPRASVVHRWRPVRPEYAATTCNVREGRPTSSSPPSTRGGASRSEREVAPDDAARRPSWPSGQIGSHIACRRHIFRAGDAAAAPSASSCTTFSTPFHQLGHSSGRIS